MTYTIIFEGKTTKNVDAYSAGKLLCIATFMKKNIKIIDEKTGKFVDKVSLVD